METGAIRQLLKNLCTNSQWCYAVFWKLQQLEHHKILTCEEVYCDSEKSEQPWQNITSDHPYTRQAEDVTSFDFGTTNVYDAHFLGYRVASAVADMSCCQYLLGEGMVGRVAVVETDFWFYSDDIQFTDLISNFGYGDEWFLPIFAAGIKTTLLASVSPYGVLQLGSLEKVDECQVLCADVRERYYSLKYTAIRPLSNYNDQLLYSILMPVSDNTSESCFGDSSLQRTMEYEDTNIIHTPEFIQNNDIPAFYDQLVPFRDNNGSSLEMEDLSLLIEDDQQLCYPIANLDIENVESSSVPNEFNNADHILELQETEMWIYELQQALGPDFLRECAELQQEAFQTVFAKDSELQEAIFKTQNACFDSEEMELSAPFNDVCEQEMLSEAVITNAATDIFRECNTSKSSVTSLTEHFAYDTINSASQGEYNTAVLAFESTFANCLTSPPSLESLESATAEDQKQLKCTFEKKNSKTGSMLNKRGKEKAKGKNRPRPRDRQLIQDRLKELRNLVPDSEKCSIDGLLDQTMKHMSFLKSVTERAQKVKHFTNEEVDYSTTNCQKNNHPNFAKDSNYEASPIIVKDLEQPSQFLIQMVCADDGVFFEIAEVMHKLKLTIVKGVMENRRNKWACYIVEASKGFNRLDIFWPLMRILQKNGNWMMANQRCP
nr:hypothetical protein [Suaeda aralocaspica]